MPPSLPTPHDPTTLPLPSYTGENKRSRTQRYPSRGWFSPPRTHIGTAVSPAHKHHCGGLGAISSLAGLATGRPGAPCPLKSAWKAARSVGQGRPVEALTQTNNPPCLPTPLKPEMFRVWFWGAVIGALFCWGGGGSQPVVHQGTNFPCPMIITQITRARVAFPVPTRAVVPSSSAPWLGVCGSCSPTVERAPPPLPAPLPTTHNNDLDQQTTYTKAMALDTVAQQFLLNIPPPPKQQHAPPPPNAPQGRGNWSWGKGRARGDNRTGQTALAKNGAERRRRRRKGQKGKNRCGC